MVCCGVLLCENVIHSKGWIHNHHFNGVLCDSTALLIIFFHSDGWPVVDWF